MMKKSIQCIFTLACLTWHAGAGELKSYAELGLLASEEDFSQFIRSPIHQRIIRDAPEALMYRVSVAASGDNGVDLTPFGVAISEKHAISGDALTELRNHLLDRRSYGSHMLDKCSFSPDYRIDFQSHDFRVSFLICTTCTAVALCVEDEYLEFLPFDPSLLKFYEILKRHFKDDEFTRNLPTTDTLLPELQHEPTTGDPFADSGIQPVSGKDATNEEKAGK